MCPLNCLSTFTVAIFAVVTAAVGLTGLAIGRLTSPPVNGPDFADGFDAGYESGTEDNKTADYEEAHADGLVDGWGLAVDWFALADDETEDDFADAVRDFYGEEEVDSEGGEA